MLTAQNSSLHMSVHKRSFVAMKSYRKILYEKDKKDNVKVVA